LSSANILRTKGEGGSSDVDVRKFWCKNYRIFRNLSCVRTNKGEEGLSQFGHFTDMGEGEVNFSRFWADVVYGRPLMLLVVLLWWVEGTLMMFTHLRKFIYDKGTTKSSAVEKISPVKHNRNIWNTFICIETILMQSTTKISPIKHQF